MHIDQDIFYISKGTPASRLFGSLTEAVLVAIGIYRETLHMLDRFSSLSNGILKKRFCYYVQDWLLS